MVSGRVKTLPTVHVKHGNTASCRAVNTFGRLIPVAVSYIFAFSDHYFFTVFYFVILIIMMV